jgi:hypothetical protein
MRNTSAFCGSRMLWAKTAAMRSSELAKEVATIPPWLEPSTTMELLNRRVA